MKRNVGFRNFPLTKPVDVSSQSSSKCKRHPTTQHEILKRPRYQLFLHCAAVPTIMCVTPYNNLSICSEGSKGMTSSLPLLSEMCSSVFGICVVILLYAVAL